MIEFAVSIEACTCALAGSGVWGINKEDSALTDCVLLNGIDSIASSEYDFVSDELDILNSVAESFWVPARFNSFPVLAVFQDAAARRENSSM